MMHLITGKKGEPHVTSENHGFLNSRLVGRGGFVFDFSYKFGAIKLNNNSVQIRSGQGMLNGRHFEIEEGQTESVSIDSGTVGMNRNDIIVARYEKAQNGYESMTLVAVKGTPASEVPTDPSITDGNILNGDTVVDFPMYRVKIVDTDIDSIEQMFTVVDFDIAEMQEAVTEALENVEETLAELEDSLEDVENKPYKYVGHTSNGEPFYVPVTDLQKKVSQGDLYLDNVSNELWYCYAITKNSSDEVTHADWVKIAMDSRIPHIYKTWSAPSTNPSHYSGVEIGDILLRYDEEYTGTINNVYIAEMVTTLGTLVVNWREIVTDRSEKWNDYYTQTQTNTLLGNKLDREDGIKIFYGTTEPTQSLLNGSKSGDIYIRLNGNDRDVSQVIGMWIVSVYPSSGAYYWQKIPLGDYYNKTETDTLLNTKQDTLTAGNNIVIDVNNKISYKEGEWELLETVEATEENPLGEIVWQASDLVNGTYDDIMVKATNVLGNGTIGNYAFQCKTTASQYNSGLFGILLASGVSSSASRNFFTTIERINGTTQFDMSSWYVDNYLTKENRVIHTAPGLVASNPTHKLYYIRFYFSSTNSIKSGKFEIYGRKRIYGDAPQMLNSPLNLNREEINLDGDFPTKENLNELEDIPTKSIDDEVVEELPTMSKEELEELENLETDVSDTELNEIDNSEVEKDVSEIENEPETIEK